MKKQTAEKITVFVFAAYIAAFFLWQFILPDREFSERENRYLQTLPEFSFRELFEGNFTEDFEDYCADQFPLRDQWITLNARYSLLCGKKETNGVYLCAGERLITPFSAPTASSLNRRIMAVEQFRENVGVPVTLSLIPDAAELYRELLPEGAPNDSEREIIEKVYGLTDTPMVDLLGALNEHKGEENALFYRTDHHWTTYGAYCAYCALCDEWGLTPQSLDELTEETVSESFYGTAYSSSGYTWIAPDRMERFVPADAASKVVNYLTGSAVETGLYKEDSLQIKDKYTYFLGGNTPRSILYGQDENLPKLLLIRDSYSDSFAPFLLKHFSEIHMLDFRSYMGSPSEYVKENGIDQVLIQYSVPNFCEQSGVMNLAQ